MWNEYENLTPEERLDRIVEILTEGALRLIEEQKDKSLLKKENKSFDVNNPDIKEQRSSKKDLTSR